jgi:hypothetical protein
MTQKKYIIILLIVSLGVFFISFFCSAQIDEVEPVELQIEDQAIKSEPVELPVEVPDIIDSMRVYPEDGRKEYTIYAVDTKELATADDREIMSERRADRQVYAIDDNTREVRIYPTAQFIYVSGGEWNYIDYATTSQWLTPAEPKPVDIIGRIFPVAYAAESYISGAGDGMVQSRNSESWANARAAALGNTTFPANSELTIARGGEYSGGYYYIHRGFLPFNTSGLTGTISAASLHIYNVARAGTTASVCVIQTTQADPTTLAIADYSALTLNSPTEGATRKALSTITDNAYFELPLNASGLTWINTSGYSKFGLRISNDVDNTGNPASDQSIYVRLSEYAGTTYDPYLAISISSTTPATATTEYYTINQLIYTLSIFALLLLMQFLCLLLGYKLAMVFLED